MLRTYRTQLILLVCIVLFIGIRSLHFTESLNFSHDQGAFSLDALKLYQNKSIVLIGPPTSFEWQGHQFYQGSVIYYLLLVFLLIGNFDPVAASYAFMVLSAVMIIPLFYGVRNLISQRAAYVMVLFYTFFPLYIDHTKFLWNPNFQFALLPVLIYLMGLYAKTKRSVPLILVGVWAGFLLMFHYQFVLIIFGIIIYYMLVKKIGSRPLLYLLLGLVIGFSPILIFELRNNFYNLQTVILLLSHASELKGGGSGTYHYLLSLSFMGVLLILGLGNRYVSKYVLIRLSIVLIICIPFMYAYGPRSYGMAENWTIRDELEVHDMIRASGVQDFNIANLVYDTQASVQKYLLLKDGQMIDEGNYTSEEYLFVMTPNNHDYRTNPSYEVKTFLPAKVEKMWKVTDRHSLFLLKRQSVASSSSG